MYTAVSHLFAFRKVNFSKFLSVVLPLRPCKMIEANEKRRSKGADDVSDVLNFKKHVFGFWIAMQ